MSNVSKSQWGIFVSVSYIENGYWIGNGVEHVAPGTGLGPDCTENIYAPISDKMTAKYDVKNNVWIEIVDNTAIDYFDVNGRLYRLNSPNSIFPDWAIFDIPPVFNVEKETVKHKGGVWVKYEILLGKKYWDNQAVEHLITDFNISIPADCTFISPPHIEENQSLVLNNREWVIKADFRGTKYWSADGTKHTINGLGEKVPDDALFEEPIIPPTLEEQTALADIECTKRINLHWNQIGQTNASLGVYGEEDTANCAAWISLNRTALIDLLACEDLLDIDVTDDEYWPVFSE